MKQKAFEHSFQSALAKLRLELLSNIEQIDVLDDAKLQSTLKLFNQRLIIAQNDFIQFLYQASGKTAAPSSAFKLSSVPEKKVPELATTILAGGTAAVLVNLITFTGSSWLFFTTSTSAATILGGLAGVSTGVATLGLGAVAGLAAGLALNKAMKKRRSEKIRNRIMHNFDDQVVEQLNKWSRDQINECVGR